MRKEGNAFKWFVRDQRNTLYVLLSKSEIYGGTVTKETKNERLNLVLVIKSWLFEKTDLWLYLIKLSLLYGLSEYELKYLLFILEV